MATITPTVGGAGGTSSGASPSFTGTVRAPRFVTDPIPLTASSGTITPNAGAGSLFRHTATANVTLADPTGGVDGQAVVVEIVASGADRTVTLAGAGGALTVPAGMRWAATWRYDAGASTWFLDDTAGGTATVVSGGGLTAKTFEDLTQTVWAAAPSPESGLAAVSTTGANSAAALQAALNYVAAVYGSGRVVLPGKTVKCNSGITVPPTVTLAMTPGGLLDQTSMPTNQAGITISATDRVPLERVHMVGPQSTRLLTDTSIGIKVVGGVRLRWYDCKVKHYGRGLDWASTDTWLCTMVGGAIEECGTCVYSDNLGVAADNAGENMRLDNVTLFNSRRALHITGNGVNFQLDGCSLDYNTEMGLITDAWVYVTGGHTESNGTVSTLGYLFKVTGNAKVSFANHEVIMGGGTNPLGFLFDPAEAPFNFGNGQAHFANTKIFAMNPAGGEVTQFSEEHIEWPSGQTTQSYFTPFPIRWTTVSAQFVAQDFVTQDAATLRVSAVPSNGSLGQFTLTASTAPSGTRFARVRFG